MADTTLRSAHPFGLPQPGRFGIAEGVPGVQVRILDGLSICLILPFRGKRAACAAPLKAALGLDLPETGRASAIGGTILAWAGHDALMAISSAGDLAKSLRDALGAAAAVVDQSDGRIVFRISGAKAIATLEKGVTIDLHPRAFAPGHVALTQMTHLPVQIRQVDGAPTFDLMLSRAFAADFWHWLEESAAEFGLVLLPDQT